MNRHALSRTESRRERKQALLLLLVVIGVGLGCFALGVMVGRSASPPAVVSQQAAPTPAHIPVTAPQATATEKTPAAADAPANLTFYDDLPRGEQPPLGSGINLPPNESPSNPAKAALPAPAPAPAAASATPAPARSTQASQSPPSRSPGAAAPAAPRPAAKGGSYLVQAASFANPDDAGVLQGRLAKKGLEAYVKQANLGSKGTWYRVFVGPLPSAAAAERVAARLKAEEKLSPLVRKR